MKEIEVKILDIDVKETRKKLAEMGAQKLFASEVEMFLFDFPNDQLLNEGKVLRVRKINGETEFCFKDKKEESKFKIREEIEVLTNNFEETVRILENIGLKKVYGGKKHRESYKLGNIKIEIDDWGDIPVFLEIEAPTEKEVQETVQKLGYSMEQATNLGTREIKKLYQKK